VLQGDLATSAGLERNKGFLEEAANHPNLNVVSTLPAYWKPEVANSATLDAYQAHPDIDAIYLPSDNAYAASVIAALRQLKKLEPVGSPNHVTLVSVDGGPVMMDAIRKDLADGSAAQDLYGMGMKAMANAVKAAKGETVSTPVINIPPIIITKKNVDDPSLWANALKF